jgi:hypothetical protein
LGALCSQSQEKKNMLEPERGATGSREQEGSLGRELGAAGRAGWGEGEKPGRPQSLAFLSLQPARTPLHRSQCPQGVETTDWR